MSDLSKAVSPENNPTLHAKLIAIWNTEKKPGWVMCGGKQYKVVQRSDGIRVFLAEDSQSLYETTSFD
jgi:hypothetical protein